MIRSWRLRPAASWKASTPAPACPYAYPDTSSDAIKAWAAKYKERTKQDPNSAAQYGYVSGDIVVKALEAAGKDLTRAKFLAALEVGQGLPADVPRPDAELTARNSTRARRRRSWPRSKAAAGRWLRRT